jgi:hypothetical protein
MDEYGDHQDVLDDGSPFRGFDQARHGLWCYESRARVYNRLFVTSFLADPKILAVHVDNWRRADRVFLTAFDHNGGQCGADTLYNGDDLRSDCSLDRVVDFEVVDPDLGLDLDERSDLAACLGKDGWTIDMRKLRSYNHDADRRSTQKAAVLAHLQDMLADGDARALLFGEDSISGTTEAGPETDCSGAA